MKTDAVNRSVCRPLPELVAQLVQTHATGVLEAMSEDGDRRDVLLVEGEIRAARSHIESEMLGSWLVGRGAITEDEKALTLLSQGSETAPPLGSLLTQRGSIDPARLEEELEALTVTILRRAARETVRSIFREGRIEDQPDTLPNTTTLQLLLEISRAFDDQDKKLAAIGAFDQVCWTNQPLESVAMELDLLPSEAYLLSRMDGTQRIADLESMSPMPRDALIDALYTLKVSGLVSLGDASRRRTLPMPTLSHEPHGPGEKAIRVDESRLAPEQLSERRHILELADQVTSMDHYRALNLGPKATRLDLRTTWEQLSKKYDPERATEPHLRDLRPQLLLIRERMEEAFEVLIDPVSRERYDRVMKALRAGRSALDGDLHERRLEAAEKARRELVEANIQRAHEFLRDGEVYQAILLLEQVCELDPTPERLLELAKLLVRNPLWAQRALRTLKQAIEARPDFTDAWIELAEFWRRRGNRERQRKALERALAADPENGRAQVMYRQLIGERELERLLRRARRR